MNKQMKYQVLALGISYELFQHLKVFFRKYSAEMVNAVTVSMALRLIAENIFYLMIIDLQVIRTGESIEFLSNIRRARVMPIMALSAPLHDVELAQILTSGVDVCLPHSSTPELISSQAQALLRHYTEYNHYDQQEILEAVPFQCGDIFIDPARQKAEVCGRPVTLRHREFSLLLYFMRNPGIVLTAGQICENAWGMDYTQPIDRAIHELRKQIEPNPHKPRYIKTVHRVGYCFTAHRSPGCND